MLCNGCVIYSLSHLLSGCCGVHGRICWSLSLCAMIIMTSLLPIAKWVVGTVLVFSEAFIVGYSVDVVCVRDSYSPFPFPGVGLREGYSPQWYKMCNFSVACTTIMTLPLEMIMNK